MLFKAQLFALTNVLPERQRIVSKGQTLKENEWNIPIDNVKPFFFFFYI